MRDNLGMSGIAPGDRVHITGGPYAGQDGTVGQVQRSRPALWIAVDGLASPALVRPEHLDLAATVADHRGHAGPACAVQWSFPALGISQSEPCGRPGIVVLADASGDEAAACDDHWKFALEVSDGAIRAVRLVK
jgi:hypothetical protein